MSIEFFYYPKAASREQLREHLLLNGFKSHKDLWRNWPDGSLNFYWFEEKDYKSITGVEATIFPPSDDIKAEHGECEWAINTRTHMSAGAFDKTQQNNVIRSARKKFGGTFINDWYGKNRYTPIEKDPRGPIGRGIFASYQLITSKLDDIKKTLPQPFIPPISDNKDLSHIISRVDPSRVIYNAMVPFSVAALEHFFGKSFKILLHYDEKAQKRLQEQSRKIDMQDVLAISSGAKTVEDIVADWYSFQNIQSINAAYKDWFGIDLWKILRQKRKVGHRIILLEKQFNNIIQFRHGVIHRFELDSDLSRDEIIVILNSAIILIESFIDYLETDRNIKIRN